MGGRLTRGRNYARRGQVLELEVDTGAVTARVQGSRARPYRVRVGVAASEGRAAVLSSLQFACLVQLARAAPAFIATEELADELGLLGANADERTRRVVHRVRQRLIEAGCAPDLLVNVRGQGYRLHAPATHPS